MSVDKTKEWLALQDHYESEIKPNKIVDLLDNENRFNDLFFQFEQLSIDFSKQKLNKESIEKLIALGNQCDLEKSIKALFNGEFLNTTENRPALHTALRGQIEEKQSMTIDGIEVFDAVKEQIEKMSVIVEKLSSGQWKGYNGKAITDVVNIGVGGSDLGPLLVCDALDEFKVNTQHPINVHFASTMDGSQIADLTSNLNPETTVFVLVSKSFGTIDTLANAKTAKTWLMSHFGVDIKGVEKKDIEKEITEKAIIEKHFIGVSTNDQKMDDWGISTNARLKLWDWVGGRFSLWSTVGLTIALKIGMDGFLSLLKGANSLDKHFFESDLENNLPVILGLVGVWNSNFLNIGAQAILPYDARLKYFPDYLTQLEMESNGKSVEQDGKKINYHSCPILWGEVGPNAQHAFYQLLHQGTRKVACDFIAPISRFSDAKSAVQESLKEQHTLTLANCFAQSRALMLGSNNSRESFENSKAYSFNGAHKYYSGDQPSTTILINELTPYNLGQLIALYEHKVFVMATIWNINPFDQWGVELGKTMANEALEGLNSESKVSTFDCSTNGLMNFVKAKLKS